MNSSSHLPESLLGSTRRTSLTYEMPGKIVPPRQPRNNQTVGIAVAILASLFAVSVPVGLVVYKFAGKTFASSGFRIGRGLGPTKSNFEGTLAGLKIVGVQANSSAARVGLKYGDILVAYDNRPAPNADEISAVRNQRARA